VARKDFVLLRAGHSLERTLDLSASYHVSRPADYHVQLNLRQLEFYVPRSAHPSAKARLAARRIEGSELREGKAEFTVRNAAGRAPTRGQMARANFAGLSVVPAAKRLRRTDGPLTPTVRDGTASQTGEILQAHQRGFALCQKALESLDNGPAYREWFGAPTERRRAKVYSVYTKIVQRMQSIPFVYQLEGRACRRGAFAYTFKNLATIWLCDSFWSAAVTGPDSKAGALIHEHSHNAARTDDLTYGRSQARDLAAHSPDRAIRNADNYQYFAEG
jgi:peptidyl-Lys metalloendopeptidase